VGGGPRHVTLSREQARAAAQTVARQVRGVNAPDG
jgi:hypothetical protein